MTGGVYRPNGLCPDYTSGEAYWRLVDEITKVHAHRLTLKTLHDVLMLDDSPISFGPDVGGIVEGRKVVVHGYWNKYKDIFYVTRVEFLN